MISNLYSTHFKVRDSECDLSGIVNHAVYLHYFEHTRHEFLKSIGINFADLALSGKHLVVVDLDIKYLRSLKPNDEFIVFLKFTKVSKIKFHFEQEIQLLPTREICTKSNVSAISLKENGRPARFIELDNFFKKLQ